MLRITSSKNAGAATAYYNSALSKQDYYADERNVAGIWSGLTAQRLGLSGEVTKEQFEKIVNNRIPGEEGQEQKLTPRDNPNRRAGYDFTFNAPKSVSVAYAINNDENLLKAHQIAVARAMQEVERGMQTQQRGQDNLTTGNALFATFDHQLTRPVEHTSEDGQKQYIPDPHMHSHSFLFNATWCEDNQRYQSVEIGNIKADAPYYEAIYHAAFRQEVMKAGYDIERVRDKWELKLIDRQTIEAFSNRTKEVEQAAMEKGVTYAQDKAQLGARTRLKKNNASSEEEVKQHWNDRLTLEQKYDLNAAVGAKRTSNKPVEMPNRISADMAVDMALRHFLENKSSVPEKRVLGEALNKGNFTLEEIQAAYEKRGDIIGYDQNTRRIITTRETLNEEKAVIAHAASQKDRYKALNPDYVPKREYLNEGQKAAITHALTSQDGVVIINGGAGTGKTSLLQEVREGITESGKQLFAFAPSAAASREVLREKGFEDADTIKKLLDDKKLHEKLNGQVVLIDEAGMVGVKTMNGIFDIAKAQNARVILSGDHRQHNAVEAGDALKLLQDRAGLKAASVSEVVRQKNTQYKEAIEDLSDGKTKEGFNKLDKMGAIREIEDQDERYRQIANDYLESLQQKIRDGKKYRQRTALVVSPTHMEGQKVTDVIRNKLREEQRIGQEDRTREILRPLHYTDSYKEDAANYDDGMVVRIHYNIKGFKAGSECEVAGRDDQGRVLVKRAGEDSPTALPLDQAQKFSVYQKGQSGFTEGDVIQATSNLKSIEGNALNNGNKYKIKEFTKEGDIKLDNGATLSKDERFIKHGYYSTSMSAQGKDADDVLITQSADSLPATNEKQFYVSTSRGAKTCRIYTDDKEELLKAASLNDGNRQSATEVANRGAQQNMERSWELALREVEQYNQKQLDYGERETIRPEFIPQYGYGYDPIPQGPAPPSARA